MRAIQKSEIEFPIGSRKRNGRYRPCVSMRFEKAAKKKIKEMIRNTKTKTKENKWRRQCARSAALPQTEATGSFLRNDANSRWASPASSRLGSAPSWGPGRFSSMPGGFFGMLRLTAPSSDPSQRSSTEKRAVRILVRISFLCLLEKEKRSGCRQRFLL